MNKALLTAAQIFEMLLEKEAFLNPPNTPLIQHKRIEPEPFQRAMLFHLHIFTDKEIDIIMETYQDCMRLGAYETDDFEQHYKCVRVKDVRIVRHTEREAGFCEYTFPLMGFCECQFMLVEVFKRFTASFDLDKGEVTIKINYDGR